MFLSRDRSAGEDLFIFYCYHHWLSPSSCVVKVKSKVSSQTENKTLLLSHISFFNRGVFAGPLKTRQFNSAGASKSGRVRGPRAELYWVLRRRVHLGANPQKQHTQYWTWRRHGTDTRPFGLILLKPIQRGLFPPAFPSSCSHFYFSILYILKKYTHIKRDSTINRCDCTSKQNCLLSVFIFKGGVDFYTF